MKKIRKYNLYQIDAFTKEKFTGNPAGVITNADGLSEEEMLKIARELNNSETAFIFSSNVEEYDVHVRYFMPSGEVPICGHATIAAHYARALEKQLKSCRVIQKTGAGILPVDIHRMGNDYEIEMTQGEIVFDDILDDALVKEIVLALGIDEEDLHPSCPIQIVSTGNAKVMIGLKDKNILDTMSPSMESLKNISKKIDCNGFYPFVITQENGIVTYGRMFAPISGIEEDPVTGNANGPLGAYLIHHHLVEHDNHCFIYTAVQGEAIKRRGTMNVKVDICEQEPVNVRISGKAIIAFQTTLEVEGIYND